MMTAQQVFDLVSKHLLQQGRPSFEWHDGDITCLYRDGAGCKCAVGVLISDEDYHPDMEYSPVRLLVTIYNLPDISRHIQLLADLQEVHDDSKHWIEGDTEGDRIFDLVLLKLLLAEVALDHGLQHD